jgi:tetratricopeptide (TPR) repeat protein
MRSPRITVAALVVALIALPVGWYAKRVYDRRQVAASDDRGVERAKKNENDESTIFDMSLVGPDYFEALLDGDEWYERKEYDKAIAHYGEAIRLSPNYAKAFCARGHAWAAKKEYDMAIKDYDEAIRLDPKYTNAIRNRGNAWLAKKEYGKAIKDYDEAIRLEPKLPYGYCNRARARAKLKQYDDAARDFGDAIKLPPSWA